MAAFFAITIWLCWLRGAWDMAITIDNQHYFFIAERAASGVPPHVSHFDPKNALAMLVSAAGMDAGRVVGLDDAHASRLVSLAVTGASVALAWALAVELSGSMLAGHLAALIVLCQSGFLLQGSMGNRPKVFMAAFMLAALLAVARDRPARAGVAAGCAFLCWQPALLVSGAAAAAFAFTRRPMRKLARFAAGLLVAVALYELYFVYKGALADQLEQAYEFPFHFMAHRVHVLSRNARYVFHIGPGLRPDSLLPLALAAVLAAGWGTLLVRPRSTVARLRDRPGFLCLGLAATVALGFTLYDYQGYPDAFLILPFEAVAVAAGGAFVVRTLRERGWRRLAGAVAVAALVALTCVAVVGGVRKSGRGLLAQMALGRAVGQMLARGQSIYAIGCTHLLAFNHVDNFVRYGFFFRGIEHYLARRYKGGEGFRPLRDGRMPDIVLLSRRSHLPDGLPWLAHEYREATPGAFRRQRVQVWRRLPALSSSR